MIDYVIRTASPPDTAALEALIRLSARRLQAAFYSPAQIESALGPVFAVDGRLISDQTYFVADSDRGIVGCGGWSKRETLFGAHQGRGAAGDRLLDPAHDAARIRAFFVHPAWARRGIGTALMRVCERAAAAAGFTRMELVATLAGEPLYAAFAFDAVERCTIPLPGGLTMQVVRMRKSIAQDATIGDTSH